MAGRMLEQMGLARLDTDTVAREVVEPGSAGLQEVVREFGNDVLGPDGSLDRARLGSLVFSDPRARKRLEEILHPLIWERVRDFLQNARLQHTDAVVEVPLLFENDRAAEFDEVWVISTSPQLQRSRLRERNDWSEDEIDARLHSQMPLSAKVALADRVFDNSDDPESLERQLRLALSSLRSGGDRA